MKSQKGDAGYICIRKKQTIVKTVLEFGIVIALLILGIVQTGDRLNLLTVVAVLGCLPASKALVEAIMIMPHRSISKEMASEIEQHASHLTMAFDMVFTSEKKIMPVESVVISGNTICGYSSSQKIDINFTTKHMKQYLEANNFTKVTVKIFADYDAFLKRIEEMDLIASDEKDDRREMAMRQVLLNISL